MVKHSEAEMDAASLEQIREWALEEQAEIEAEAAKQAAGEVETPEQIAEREAAEKEAADKAAADEAEKEAAEKAEQERDELGRFKKTDEPPENEEDEPDEWIVHREIDLGDGSGVQTFIGHGDTELDAYKDLNEKLLTAQENATRKIREQNQELQTRRATETQQKVDEEFVDSEEYKKDPRGYLVKKIKQGVVDALAEQKATDKRHLQAQLDFVAIHPEYVADTKSGNAERLTSEFQRLYPDATEFTVTGLNKAFDNLKQSGLLVLRAPEASVPTETKVETKVVETPRIEETPMTPVTPVTPARSPRRASSVSTVRSGTPVVKTEPSEDELYDEKKWPLEKLRDAANRQLAGVQ